MSIMFYYVAIATAMRAKASYKAYKKLADLLDDGDGRYSRESVASLKFGKLFNLSLAIGIITAMFFSLIIIAAALIINQF